MMYYEQQQPARIETARDEREAAARRKTAAVDEERLEIVDLSGLSLDSLPSPSLDLGIICKLDLSNNNLQVNNNTSMSLSLSLMPTSKKKGKRTGLSQTLTWRDRPTQYFLDTCMRVNLKVKIS